MGWSLSAAVSGYAKVMYSSLIPRNGHELPGIFIFVMISVEGCVSTISIMPMKDNRYGAQWLTYRRSYHSICVQGLPY